MAVLLRLSSNLIGMLKGPLGDVAGQRLMTQVKLKGSKVKVKYSKLNIFAASIGSFNQYVFRPDRYIKALEVISQYE